MKRSHNLTRSLSFAFIAVRFLYADEFLVAEQGIKRPLIAPGLVEGE
jgi:hypothetical protein